jgi:hypothetical protein
MAALSAFCPKVLFLAFAAAAFAACERTGSASAARPDTVVARSQIGDSLELTARSVTRHDSLVTRVEVRNTTTSPLPLEWGACALSLRLFNPDSEAVAVYDSSLRPELPDSPRACFAYLVKRTIAPGEMIAPQEFTWEHPLQCILGDSLPSGVYRGILTVAFSRSRPVFRRVDFEVDGGRLQIRPSRAKLPSNQRCN